MAVSFASVPLEVKNDLVSLPSGVMEAIFFASADCGSLANTVDTCCKRVHLLVKLGIHGVIAMPHTYGDDAAKEVEILIAVGVPNVLVLGARNDPKGSL